MTNRDSATGFAIGFFVGAAIGLAIGFLYAPQPGEETREILKEKAGEMRGKAVAVVEKVKETATAVRQKTQEKLKKAGE